MTQEELIDKLVTIGQAIINLEHIPIRTIGTYVGECQKEFGLSQDEVKTILYRIIRSKD